MTDALALASLLLLAFSAAACTSVDPAPFQKLHTSVAAFQEGSDAALGSVHDLARQAFTDRTDFDEDITLDSVILEFDDEIRPVLEAAPLYTQIGQLRQGAFDLNGAIEEYARYLRLLARGHEEDAIELERLAKQANTNLRSARDTLGVDTGDESVALIATLGVELLRRKIEHDRRDALRQTMDEAMVTIDRFSTEMQLAMSLLAGDVGVLYAAWIDGRRAPYREGDPAARRRIIVEVLEHNERTVRLLDSIRTLEDGYRNLPAAHREVRVALDAKDPFLAAVGRLHADARRLEALHRELSQAATEPEARGE